MTLTPYNAGWIEVICGSMFSGKTEELIRRLRRAEIAKLSVVIFKPKVDNRFSKNFIVSHNKTKMKSIIIENVENIISQSKKYDVIVGMYHDQVLSPMKALFNFDAINITLGLPFTRISPDHGPNTFMLGKNLSDPKSLINAIKFLDN